MRRSRFRRPGSRAIRASRPIGQAEIRRLTTSVVSCFPLSSMCRPSRVGSSPAATAAAFVTRISARCGQRCQPCCRVHRIAHGGQLDMRALADRSEPRRRRIDPWPRPEPRGPRIGMSRRAQQRLGRADALLGVIVAAEKRHEHRHELVADELVDGPVVIEHHARGDRVEPIEEAVVIHSATSSRPASSTRGCRRRASSPRSRRRHGGWR